MTEDGATASPRAARLIGYLVLCALGLYGVTVALKLGLWRERSPGEGLFPFLAAASMAAFSLFAFLTALIARGPDAPASRGEGRSLLRVGAYLATLLFYALALESLGFLVATVIAVAVILRFAERYSWLTTLVIAIATAAFCHLLFALWLGAILPTGTVWERLFN